MGTNIVCQAAASGSPTVDSNPGESGLGFLMQGFLERSNVELSGELSDLYDARRQYDAVLQAFATGVAGVTGSPDK